MKTIIRSTVGVSAAALVLAALAFGGATAAEKKKAEAKPPVCNSLKAESDCEGRADCTWVSAAIDAKTKKQKAKAYCRAKPKAKAAPKTKS